MAFERRNNTAEKKKAQERNKIINASRMKYIVISAILFVIALIMLIFILWAKGGMGDSTSEQNMKNLYNASRYFCRLKYPEGWDVQSGDNGFYLDENLNLIFQVYPYRMEDAPIELSEGETPPAVTPEPIKVQIEDALVSVYYKDVGYDEILPSPTPEGATPVPDNKDAAPTEKPKAYSLDVAGEAALDFLRNQLLPGKAVVSEGDPEDYGISDPNIFEGKNITFKTYSYAYKNQEGTSVFGDIYVCTRAMSYYILNFEASEDKYVTYKDAFISMANNFILSVFDY